MFGSWNPEQISGADYRSVANVVITGDIIHGDPIRFTDAIQRLPGQHLMANPFNTAAPYQEQQCTNDEYPARRQHSNNGLYLF
jgi:hypothetical protein